MTDPARLVDSHPSDVARSLLNAGLGEEPSPALLERTLAPLGLGVTTLAVVETAQAGTAGAAAGAASAAPPAAALVGSSILATTVKWVGIAGVGGGVLIGAATNLSPSGSTNGAPGTTVQPATTTVVAPAAVEAPRPVVDLPAAAEPAAPAPSRSSAPAGRTARSNPDAEATKRSALLAEEAAAIDEAREAVATGDTARALRALAAHRQKFDKPLLKPEALFLEMRALRAQGDLDGARRVAERLLEQYPNGPQAAAARSFLRSREQ